MIRFRNVCFTLSGSDDLRPTRDRSARRSPKYAPERLEGRLSPSSFDGLVDPPAEVESLVVDIPPPDPIDYPPPIPPYEPPIPPDGPATPK